MDAFLSELLRRIGPCRGYYLRPFVSDGHPSDCQIAIIGYNSATQIPTEKVTPEDYCRLLVDRSAFEKFYTRVRKERKLAEGKKRPQKLSPTRRRLGKIREAFNGSRVVESNINALPTADTAELNRMPDEARQLGRSVAKWTLSLLRPEVVITYGSDIKIPDTFHGLCSLQVADQKKISRYLTIFEVANWNGGRTRLAHFSIHLAARGTGIKDVLFSELGIQIREHIAR